MNILHLHPGPDTGGQSMRGKAVLEAAGHTVRVIVRSDHQFGYAQAERWRDDEVVREAYSWADTVILHNQPAELFAKVDDGSTKRLVVHHHGTRFRQAPIRHYRAAEAIGATQIFSTVDLLLQIPAGGHGEWFGQVIDVEAMQAIRTEHYRPGRRFGHVVHCPTNQQIKGTRWVKMAGRQMRYEATFQIVSRRPWSYALQVKAGADVFIDQLALGYGNNAIEAWAMGIPVLGGVSNEGGILPVPAAALIDRMHQEYGGPLPFYQTTGRGLPADIRRLLKDRDLRAEWARRGMEHVQRFHSHAAWLARAERVYGIEPELMVA